MLDRLPFSRVLLVAGCALALLLTMAVSAEAHGTRSLVMSSFRTADPVANGHYCNGCMPPLVYNGGPVLDTHGPRGLTITPVYWEPPSNSLPVGYASIIDGYIANVAAASQTLANVYSIDTEYYDVIGGRRNNIRYLITAGTPIFDHDPLPPSGCTTAGAQYNACITDAQLRAELSKVLRSHHLGTGLANMYPMFFAPRIETQDRDHTNSDSTFCGYHRSYLQGGSVIVYGNEPYETTGCGGGQSPNGNFAADASVSTLSHEVNEATTDPETDPENGAWQDNSGSEIGDLCASAYGPSLGSTNPGNAQGSEYNQVINGGKYYTQEEFSNFAYKTFGVGQGCQVSEAAARHEKPPTSTSVTSMVADPYPSTLPANGRATSAVSVTIGDKAGYAVPNDEITFFTYAEHGTGLCGRLSRKSARTGNDGSATITYTASKANVVCAIVAQDAKGGKSATAVVYQGSTQSGAPTAQDTFPARIKRGQTQEFTTTFTNRSSKRINDLMINFSIFPGDASAPNVNADQVDLELSVHGPSGHFGRVHLTGSTVTEGAIQAGLTTLGGGVLRPGQSATLTYKITLAPSAPRYTQGPLISLESYLIQVNPASGAGAVLADTAATDARVSRVRRG